VTLEGAAFLAKIEPLVFGLVEALAAPIRGDDHVRRVLRINTPLPAVLYLLPEIIPAFGRRPPLVEPELHHEERLTDVVAQGCDAGIRLSKIVSGDMIGVRFGKPLRWIAETSPAYMEQCAAPGMRSISWLTAASVFGCPTDVGTCGSSPAATMSSK
jgi:DNA-binding transcriptional LysR family regulator